MSDKELVHVGLYGDGKKHANRAEEIWCDIPDQCPLRVKGMCACVTFPFSKDDCQHGEVRVVRGYTRRAMKYGEFCKRIKDNPVYGALNAIGNVVMVERVGDQVLFVLKHASLVVGKDRPYQASKVGKQDLYICNPFCMSRVTWVPKEMIDAETLADICGYRPVTLVGCDEIKGYQEKTVPLIVEQLRLNWPEMYDELIELRPELAECETNYVGMTAKLSTLRDGIGINDGNGNVFVKKGGLLTCERYGSVFLGGSGWTAKRKDAYVSIPIEDDMAAKVEDNEWVVPGETEFV